MSSEAFIESSLSQDPPPAAQIGNQERFVTLEDGQPGVDDLFCLEKIEIFLTWLRPEFGVITLPHRNAAPGTGPLHLSAELEARLKAARAAEFELYARVADTGHYALERPQA